jgi:hypothetical protein
MRMRIRLLFSNGLTRGIPSIRFWITEPAKQRSTEDKTLPNGLLLAKLDPTVKGKDAACMQPKTFFFYKYTKLLKKQKFQVNIQIQDSLNTQTLTPTFNHNSLYKVTWHFIT